MQKETSEVDEVGEEDAAVTVEVSAGVGLPKAKPTRTSKGRLNKEPLRVRMHKALLHQRRLPLPQDSPMSSNTKSPIEMLRFDVSIATR